MTDQNTDQTPQRRSDSTHLGLIIVLVIVGILAAGGYSLHHFGEGVITIDGRDVSDLNFFETIIAVLVGIIGTIIGVLVALLATVIGLAAGLIGLFVGLLGAAIGLIVGLGVLVGPLLLIGLIVWLIVKASSSGKPPASSGGTQNDAP